MISVDEDGLLSELGPLLAIVVPDTVRTEMHLIGELDILTAPILDTLIEQQIATGHIDVRIDLSRLAFCDVLGLRALLRARRHVAAVDGHLVLLRPTRVLVRIAVICGVAAQLGLPTDSATPPAASRNPSS